MQRQPEPSELMDEAMQAEAYARADFSEPNARFLEEYAARFPEGPKALTETAPHALDLGCGPADITLAFARRYPDCFVVGVDGAPAMLSFGRDRLTADPLGGRVQLVCGHLPGVQLPHAEYDVILSNSLLHHLPDPGTLWRSLRAYGRPGAQIVIMDLFRPASPRAARAIVEQYAADEPEILRRDFYRSLLAAFAPTEVEAQLHASGLDPLTVTVVSDRHLLVSGHLPQR